MQRLPFDLIEDFACSLMDKVALSGPFYEIYKNLYNQYLLECGWTDSEFDQELSARVDNTFNERLH